MKKIILFLGVVILMGLVSAADFTPQGNINMRDYYNITNVPEYNGTNINITGNYYGNGSQLTDISASTANQSTWWGIYRYASDLNNLITSMWANITNRPTHLTNFTNDLGIGNWTNDSSNYYNTTQTNSQIESSNTSMKTYVDALDTSTNDSMKIYVDNQDTTFNDSIKTYVDDVNSSQTSWTDLFFVRFTELVAQVGNFSAWDKSYDDLIETPDVLSNFSDDLGDRGYTSNLNFTNDAGYYNSTTPQTETDPLWTGNQSSYSTTVDIIAFGYYNSTDFVITDYYSITNPYGFYNSTDFSISNYFTSAEVLAFNYYNSTDFSISDYVSAVTLAGYNYYNSTDFSISDYATNIKVDSIGNFSDWDKDYNDLINTPTFTNDTWVDTYFVRFTELVGQIGNWTLDKVSYSTKAEADLLYYDLGNSFEYWNDTYSTFNKTYADGLYYGIGNSLSFLNQSQTDLLYAILGYGDDWNKTYADTLYYDLGNSLNYWNDTFATFNKSYADTLYREESWDNFTGIPTATPADGDDTHLSTANQIRDYVIGLAYTPIADLVGLLGNWSADKADYSTTAEAGNLYATIDEPLWTANQSSYSTKAVADGLYSGIEWDYNQTTPAITYADGKFFSDIVNFTGTLTNAKYCVYTTGTGIVCNSESGAITETDPVWTADKTDYSTTAEAGGLYAGITEPVALSLGNWSADKGDYSTTTAANLLYYGIENPYSFYNTTTIPAYLLTETDPLWTGNQSSYSTTSDILGWSYYNSTDFTISDYYLDNNPDGFINWANAVNGTLALSTDIPTDNSELLNGFGYYNSTDFSILDYYTQTQIDNFNYYNSSDFSIGDYSTTSSMNTAIENANTSMKTYVDLQDTSFNTSIKTYADNTFYLKSNPYTYWNSTFATFNKTYADGLYADIAVTGGNSSWNETYADTLYRADDWNNFTGIPHATPSDNDVTHFSYANDIYDWVIGLGFLKNNTDATLTSLAVTNSPSECPAGSFMTYTNMTTSVCTSYDTDVELDYIKLSNTIKLNSTPANATASGTIINYTVDTNAYGFGALLYIASDGNLETAIGTNTSATTPVFAMALETGTGMKNVLLNGIVNNTNWDFSSNDILYLSNATSGAIIDGVPLGSGNMVQIIGIALSADKIYFNPDYTMVEIT